MARSRPESRGRPRTGDRPLPPDPGVTTIPCPTFATLPLRIENSMNGSTPTPGALCCSSGGSVPQPELQHRLPPLRIRLLRRVGGVMLQPAPPDLAVLTGTDVEDVPVVGRPGQERADGLDQP